MTTIAESFNKANDDILGPGLTWVEDQGDVDIVSNRARGILTGAAVARAAHSLATDNQYAEIVAYTNNVSGLGLGPIVRKQASSTLTFYFLWLYCPSAYQVALYKVVAGAFTALGATVAATFVNGDTLRIECNGTTIRGLINGVEVVSRTDSSITTGPQTGIRFYDNDAVGSAEADSFAAGDLAAAAASLIYYQPAIAPLLVR